MEELKDSQMDETRGAGARKNAYRENSESFFQNKACKYFPCHDTDDPDGFNCLFCYCPLYMLGSSCGGNYSYTEKGIKNCKNCSVPHGRNAAEYIRSRFPEIARVALENSLAGKTE